MNIWHHLRAIALLPGIVTIVVPWLILETTHSTQLAWGLAMPLKLLPLAIGVILLGLGLFLLVLTIKTFDVFGEGTLAPWNPTKKLVVQGVYRYVRNPMITGVWFILLGEVAAFGSMPIFYWFIVFLLLNVFYIPLIEEQDLLRKFGADYERYRQNVPRWIPRLTPWNSANGL